MGAITIKTHFISTLGISSIGSLKVVIQSGDPGWATSVGVEVIEINRGIVLDQDVLLLVGSLGLRLFRIIEWLSRQCR